jgi:hypothetical protein
MHSKRRKSGWSGDSEPGFGSISFSCWKKKKKMMMMMVMTMLMI